MDVLKISNETSPKVILESIASLREQKGKERETLALIEEALLQGHYFVIDLFWEEALVYQHKVMTERSKSAEEKDRVAEKKALIAMEGAIIKAKFYIEKYQLSGCYSRLHRFLGRLNDYKGNFRQASIEYKKAIPLVKTDPEYLEKKLPRWLELEGFLSYSLIMSGKVKEGVSLAKRVFRKFDEAAEGKFLKKKDYYIWAIWKSGIPIRTVSALLDKRFTFNKKEMLKFIDEAERILAVPKGVRTWGDEKFTFRNDEIANLKRRLIGN